MSSLEMSSLEFCCLKLFALAIFGGVLTDKCRVLQVLRRFQIAGKFYEIHLNIIVGILLPILHSC